MAWHASERAGINLRTQKTKTEKNSTNNAREPSQKNPHKRKNNPSTSGKSSEIWKPKRLVRLDDDLLLTLRSVRREAPRKRKPTLSLLNDLSSPRSLRRLTSCAIPNQSRFINSSILASSDSGAMWSNRYLSQLWWDGTLSKPCAGSRDTVLA